MPSSAEQREPAAEASTDHHGSRPGRLHVPALRQLYSRVALRGRRKSTATTESTVSSRPVVVRTYSPASRRSRASPSRSPSSAREQQSSGSAAMHPSPHPPPPPPHLPPTADFSFAGIMHAVEPEISGAIDAIAAICARSKLCLADEYAAHRPPHEVLDPANPIPLPASSANQRTGARWWNVVRDTALAAVPEASSSSERLTGSRTASRASLTSTAGVQSAKGGAGAGAGKKSTSSAYGSFKSLVSGGGDGSGSENRRRGLAALFGSGAAASQSPPSSTDFAHAQWMVPDDGSGAIRLSPASAARAASPRVSLAITEDPIAVNGSAPFTSTATVPAGDATTARSPSPRRTPRNRSNSSSGWLQSWSSGSPRDHRNDDSRPGRLLPATGSTAAERRLKWLLEASSALRGAPLVKQCGGRMMAT